VSVQRCSNNARLVNLSTSITHVTKNLRIASFNGVGQADIPDPPPATYSCKFPSQCIAKHTEELYEVQGMIILLLFLQKQNLAFAVYLFGSVLSLPD